MLTMSTSSPCIEDLLLDAMTWQCGLDGRLVACVADHMSGMSKLYTVTDQDLASCHPLFPAAMRGLVAWCEEDDGRSAPGDSMLATLECLRFPPVHLRGPLNEHWIFSAIGNIELRPHFPEYAWISGRRVFMTTADETLHYAPFVTKTENDQVRVELHYLSQHYPGWEQRWKIGLELGIQHDDLMGHVFDKNWSPITPVATTDITFD